MQWDGSNAARAPYLHYNPLQRFLSRVGLTVGVATTDSHSARCTYPIDKIGRFPHGAPGIRFAAQPLLVEQDVGFPLNR